MTWQEAYFEDHVFIDHILRKLGWVGVHNTWKRPEWEGKSVGWGIALAESCGVDLYEDAKAS